MLKKIRFETLDVDWFIVDSKGYIGHFTTGGTGLLPDVVKKNFNNQVFLLKTIINLSHITSIEIIPENVPKGSNIILDDYFNMSKRGIFSYDVSSLTNSTSLYKLISYPLEPIKINIFSDKIQETFKSFIISDFSLNERNNEIDIADIF